MTSYARWVIRQRWTIIALTLAVTTFLGLKASGLKVVIDPDALMPAQHPYVQSTVQIRRVFGSEYMVLVGVTPKQGDLFQQSTLQAVEEITRGLERLPGVIQATLLSIASRQAKSIKGTAEGFEVTPLMPADSRDAAQLEALRQALDDNPVYLGSVISADRRTAGIVVELKERSDGFRPMMQPVNALIAQTRERHPGLDIRVSGDPVYLVLTEMYS